MGILKRAAATSPAAYPCWRGGMFGFLNTVRGRAMKEEGEREGEKREGDERAGRRRAKKDAKKCSKN